MSLSRVLARMMFHTAPDGRRLFRPYGLFGPSYDVPDDSETRVAWRAAWGSAGCLVVSLAGLAALVAHSILNDRPLLNPDPVAFLAVVGATIGASYLVTWAIVRSAVRGLPRGPRLTWRANVARLAAESSPVELAALAAVSAVMSAGGLLTAAVVSPVIGLTGTALFAICAAGFAHAFLLQSGPEDG